MRTAHVKIGNNHRTGARQTRRHKCLQARCITKNHRIARCCRLAHQHAAQDHASALIAIYRSIADTRSTEVLDQRLPALRKQNWAQTHKLQMLRRSNADLRAENWALQRELDRIGQSVPPGPTGVRSGSDRPRSGFWFRIETSGAALRVIAILLALRDALKSIRRE